MKVRILESARRDPDQTGLRGWILDAAAAEGLRKGMQQVAGAKVIDRPRFSTGDGIASCMIAVPSGPSSSMPTGPGLRFDLFPRLRGNTTDLIFAIMSWTSSTHGAPTIKEAPVLNRTNFLVAVRMQVPKGSAAFLLFPGCDGSKQDFMAAIVEPKQK